MKPKTTAKNNNMIQLCLLAQINEACPLSIIKSTKKVIILLCTLRVLALFDKLMSKSFLFKAEAVIFLPFGTITKNTLKNIIQPKITPTDKKANLEPKIFVKPNEIIPPIMRSIIEKIILLFINLDLQIKS